MRCSASRSAACLGLAIFKIFSSRILPPSSFPSSLSGNLFLASRQGPHKEGNPQGIRCRSGNSTRLRWTLQPTSYQITLHLFPTDRNATGLRSGPFAWAGAAEAAWSWMGVGGGWSRIPTV